MENLRRNHAREFHATPVSLSAIRFSHPALTKGFAVHAVI